LPEARLPVGKTLPTLYFEAVQMVSKAQLVALAAGDSWLEKGAKFVPVRPTWHRQDHLAAAIGLWSRTVSRVEAKNLASASNAFSIENGQARILS
jgi:hypothetical protein